jgi:hypothetical protein
MQVKLTKTTLGLYLYRILVYSRFWFMQGLVYSGFWFIQGFGLFRVLV